MEEFEFSGENTIECRETEDKELEDREDDL